MSTHPRPHLEGMSIGDAYTQAVKYALRSGFPYDYLTIHIEQPVSSMDDLPVTKDVDDWAETINAGDALEPFSGYEFHDGTTGRFWLNDRVDELFNGMYAVRLREPAKQLKMIVERLQKGNHGQTTNALVAQVFKIEPDLEMATTGRPMAPDMACMTQLQFRPDKEKLHLFSTFRSQYLDTKCYGNLVSLAILQALVCKKTGYEPGILVETAHNVLFRDYKDANNIHTLLTSGAPNLEASQGV